MYIPDGSTTDYAYRSGQDFSSCKEIARHLARENLTIKEVKKVRDECRYFVGETFKNIYAWGWIEKDIPQKGWKDSRLKKKIVQLMAGIPKEMVVDHFCGFHTCNICGEYWFEGSIKIRHKNTVFCCPHGVEHYIDIHDYRPDDRVLDAIQNGHIISPDDIFDDLVKLHSKKIEQERVKFVVEQAAVRKRHEEYLKKAEEYKRSLTPTQRRLLDSAMKHDTSAFVPLDE